MADFADFEGANSIMYAPEGQEDTVGDLPVFRYEGGLVSCWQLTDEELKHVQETRCVWLHILGQGMPPVAVGGLPMVQVPDGHGGVRDARPIVVTPRRSRRAAEGS